MKSNFEEKFVQNNKSDMWFHDIRISQKYRFILYMKIISELDCNRDLLEIGCGNAHFIRLISQKLNFKLYGIDISSTAIQNASNFISNAEFKVGELPEVDYFKKNFFLICILEVLYYINKVDQLKSLYNSINCLDNDGYILISVVINHRNYIDEEDFLKKISSLNMIIHKKFFLYHKYYNLFEKPFLKIYRKLFLCNSIISKFISSIVKCVISNEFLYNIIVFLSRKYFSECSKSHLVILVGKE